MTDRPGRGELLQAAEDALRDDVLPALEGPARYAGLMVASALATARRELDQGEDAARRILDAYAGFYGEDNVARAGGTATRRIAALNRDLARELRDGSHDATLLGPVSQVLETLVVERLRLSNPRFLEASEYSQPLPE